ncbi:MAG: hypothetical protein CVU80_00520 [Elusimicrobia bacterium HGW-Elusimicrobia-4]|nr:MAG: hypothetical protein CVU80_00520 [Elusimicrobia bacterium HGW-Elusimicrobia-4]
MRQIEKTSIFTRDLQKLPEDIQKEAWDVSCILKENIFDSRLAIKKLEGCKKVWRVTVKKDYRMVYTFSTECIYLLRIKHRKDIYRIEI